MLFGVGQHAGALFVQADASITQKLIFAGDPCRSRGSTVSS